MLVTAELIPKDEEYWIITNEKEKTIQLLALEYSHMRDVI
jgi:hypothetical protein